MPSQVFQIKILRTAGQKGLGTGKVKTATGGYTDAGEEPIRTTGDEPALEGSPFPCRYFRKRQQFTESQRDESELGITNIDVEQTLSILRPGADVRIGDIAILPKGTVYADRECRAQILKTRFYRTGIQCDIETGSE